jgi:hypothetical protein
MSAAEGKVAALNARVSESYHGPATPECLQKPMNARSAWPAARWTFRLRRPILYAFTHALNNMHRKPVFNLGFGPFVFAPVRDLLLNPLAA